MKPRKLTRTPWSDRFDIPGVPFSTPTFDSLARRGLVDRHSHRNAWGWFEWSYSITAAGAVLFVGSL